MQHRIAPLPRLSPLTLSLRLILSGATLGATLAAGAAAAQQTDAALPAVTVVGHNDDSYLVPSTSAGTKTDTALRDLPQSVTVINQALMRDLSMQSMADVARYVP